MSEWYSNTLFDQYWNGPCATPGGFWEKNGGTDALFRSYGDRNTYKMFFCQSIL